MKAIVLTDSLNGIARRGKQILYLKEDLRRFREITMEAGTVIVGRKTAADLPNGKPLSGRENIMVTYAPAEADDGFRHMTIEEIQDQVNADPKLQNAIVIGGASIYRQLLPLVDTVYVTHVYGNFRADKFFPALAFKEWKRTDISEKHIDPENTNIRYRYETWVRRTPEETEAYIQKWKEIDKRNGWCW